MCPGHHPWPCAVAKALFEHNVLPKARTPQLVASGGGTLGVGARHHVLLNVDEQLRAERVHRQSHRRKTGEWACAGNNGQINICISSRIRM